MNAKTKREAAKVLRNYLLHNGPQLLPEFVGAGEHSAAEEYFDSILYYDSDLDIDWELKIIRVKSVENKVFSNIHWKHSSARFDSLINNLQNSKNCTLYPFLSGKTQEELEKIALDYYCRANKTCVWGDRVYFDTLQRPPSSEDYLLIWLIMVWFPPTTPPVRSKTVVQPQKMNKSHVNKKISPQKAKAVQSVAAEAFPENCNQANDNNSWEDDEIDSIDVCIHIEVLQCVTRRFSNFTIKFLLSVLQRNPLFYSRHKASVINKETGFSFEFNEFDRTWKHSKNNRCAAISLSNQLLMQLIVNQLRKEKRCSSGQLCKKLNAADTPIQAFVSAQGFTVFELIQFIVSNRSAEVEFTIDWFQLKRNDKWDQLCFELVDFQAQEKKVQSNTSKQEIQVASPLLFSEGNSETPDTKEIATLSSDVFPKTSYCRPLPSRKSKDKSHVKFSNSQKRANLKKYKFNKEAWNDTSKQKSFVSAHQEGSTNHEVKALLFECPSQKPPSALFTNHQESRKSLPSKNGKGKIINSPRLTDEKSFKVENSQNKKNRNDDQNETYSFKTNSHRAGRENEQSNSVSTFPKVEPKRGRNASGEEYIDNLHDEAVATFNDTETELRETFADSCSPGRTHNTSNLIHPVKSSNKQFIVPMCNTMLTPVPPKHNLAQISRFIRSPRPTLVPSQPVKHPNAILPVQYSLPFLKTRVSANLASDVTTCSHSHQAQVLSLSSDASSRYPVTVENKEDSASPQSVENRDIEKTLNIPSSKASINQNVGSKVETISSVLKYSEKMHINILFLRCQLQQNFLFDGVKDLYAQIIMAGDLFLLHDCWVAKTASRSKDSSYEQ